MDVEATYRESARTANVVGVLPAADSESADEYVVVGAHLDHVGPQGDGHLFPGANDNASGAAAVVAVAEALAAREAPPQRNVVFVLFAAEEQGLHGSKAFVESGVVPPEKIVAMVNLDCVGYGERLRMGGGKSAPKLWELARTLDREAEGITVEDTWWGGGADAQAFFEQGIPTLYLATKDSYAHLHQPTDTPDTLNGTLLGAVARHTYRVVSAVADGGYAREALQPRPSRN
jgi:Zn-dependent M28 family amino/carboxypeptidase